MFKGIILAVVLMLTGDLALNQGEITHILHGKLSHFATSSSEAVNNSLFNW